MLDPYAALICELVELRKDRGLRQADLAELLYASQYQISAWERRLVCPRPTMLAAWAHALGCQIGYTLTPITEGTRP